MPEKDEQILVGDLPYKSPSDLLHLEEAKSGKKQNKKIIIPKMASQRQSIGQKENSNERDTP